MEDKGNVIIGVDNRVHTEKRKKTKLYTINVDYIDTYKGNSDRFETEITFHPAKEKTRRTAIIPHTNRINPLFGEKRKVIKRNVKVIEKIITPHIKHILDGKIAVCE